MKKLIALILVFALLLPAVSLADYSHLPDVSDLSYLELMYMLGAVKRALMECGEWTSVDVPAGVYLIGSEIPAGHWTITPVQYDDFYSIGYGSKLNPTQTALDNDSIIEWLNISSDYSDAMLHRLDIVLEEGYFLYLGHASTFELYTGKSDFSFHFDD